MIDRETPTARLGAERNLIVAVVGPTASGKSDLALDLAQLLPQEMGATLCAVGLISCTTVGFCARTDDFRLQAVVEVALERPA